MRTCVQAYMLTCLHAYMRTRLHACAYMFARLYALICLDTTVFLYAYVLTCLLATPCSPTLTHIDNHLTHQDAPFQQALGIHFDSWFLHFGFRFSHWFSIRSFSKYFRLFRRFPGAQGSPARLPNYRILIFSRTHANHPLLAKSLIAGLIGSKKWS